MSKLRDNGMSEKVRQAAERLAASPEHKERQRKIAAANEQLKHIELPSVMAAPACEWPKDQRSTPAEMRRAWENVIEFKAKAAPKDESPAYRPSGMMCHVCSCRDADCSNLDFASMQRMKTDRDGVTVVKCNKFQKENKDEEQANRN